MTIKLALHMGRFGVEYEGPEEWAFEHLAGTIGSLLERLPGPDAEPIDTDAADDQVALEPSATAAPANRLDMTTNTIASKLGVKSGPDLALAAAAYLTLAEKKAKFTRKELLEAMRDAAHYYKQAMRSNLTAALRSLIKEGKFSEVAKDTYALSAAQKQHLTTVISE